MNGIVDTALVLRRCNIHHLLTRAVVGSDNHNTGNLQRSPWSRKLTGRSKCVVSARVRVSWRLPLVQLLVPSKLFLLPHWRGIALIFMSVVVRDPLLALED